MARSALHEAAARGDLEGVRALLDAGAEVNEEWSNEDLVDRSSVRTTRTPLWLAIQGGHGEAASLLLDRGARSDAYDGYDKHTPLTLAATRGLVHVVKKIVARAPPAAELDSALVRACGGHSAGAPVVWSEDAAPARAEIVRLLLAAGARSAEALWFTAYYGRQELAALLVEAGVRFERPGLKDAERSALLGAAFGGQLAMFEWLVAHGANPTSVQDEALSLAARRGDLPMVEALIGRGAAVNARGAWGWTALFHAASAGHAEVAGALLGSGADRSIKDDQGKTARDFARGEAIEKLLA